MKTLRESLQYLNSFQNLERLILPEDNYIWNLARMKKLLVLANHPEKSFFPVLIAGTKGKGSTGFFLESILESHGIRTGFYHSPHLVTPLERIRLQGRQIKESDWIQGLAAIKRLLLKHPASKPYGLVTYFEIMTLLAALVFKKNRIEIGIFEIGMGGRLDATNAIDTSLCVLTPIHFDHEAFLGNTIAKIAGEKAAIIRRHADVIVAPQKKEAMKIIVKTARGKKAKLWFARRRSDFKVGLLGGHQSVNASVALETAYRLHKGHGFPFDLKKAMKACRSSQWPGRLEAIAYKGRPVLIDSAHNPASIRALVDYLKNEYKKPVGTVLFGAMRDKNSREMLRLLSSAFREIIVTPLEGSRTQEPGILMTQARPLFRRIYPAVNAKQAIEFALQNKPSKELLVITGSFHLAGEAKRMMN